MMVISVLVLFVVPAITGIAVIVSSIAEYYYDKKMLESDLEMKRYIAAHILTMHKEGKK